MNVYMVRTRDEREWTDPITDDGRGPSFPYLPIAPVVAETPAQAKRMFLDEFATRSSTGVYHDDWNELRVRLLVRDTDLQPGLHEGVAALWFRYHEVVDHGGKPCDCPERDAA